jgi:hypothetical protein
MWNMITKRLENSSAEKESEKAARRFFGTFVKDIKRNFIDGVVHPKNWTHHLKLKGKSNVSQLTGSV